MKCLGDRLRGNELRKHRAKLRRENANSAQIAASMAAKETMHGAVDAARAPEGERVFDRPAAVDCERPYERIYPPTRICAICGMPNGRHKGAP